jgi:squalene-hopene/tetraprenyl-beta-curcumene cyclase
MDPELRGVGTSTASQTAWALMALAAARSECYESCISRGWTFLCTTRNSSGTWDEPYYTGAGFPGYGVGVRINLRSRDLAVELQQGTELSRGFMLNFNMYRHYFPLIALSRMVSSSRR